MSSSVDEQHAVIGNAGGSAAATNTGPRATHPEAQWFATAGLGLFVHFGISSARGTGDLSWSMMWQPPGQRLANIQRYGLAAAQIALPPEEYWAQAEEFSPDDYHPERWIVAAKAAGCTYAVLTTKHHDGYTLWPSAHGDLGTHTHLGGRDLVAPFVAACRQHGLKVGLYYSPPDWHCLRDHMGFPAARGKHPARGRNHEVLDATPQPDAAASARYHALLRGHLEELLTRYGRIDLLWLDGTAPGAFTHAWLRSLQPHLVINRRHEPDGDFDTPECSFPVLRPEGWWEYCHIWNDGAWAWLRHEIYKPSGWMLGELAKSRSWGGNLLINVAPGPTGDLPRNAYERLAEVARWMEHGREAVFGTSPGPWPEQCNVPVTVRDHTWYLHVPWDHDSPVTLHHAEEPTAVTLLRDGTPLAWSRNGSVITIAVPVRLRSTLTDLIAVRF
jgi:alpha-L-fucosidase